MTQYGKSIRLRRILHPGRGSLVVAFDHPLVLGPIPGTINPGRQIARFIEGKADAVLLNLGMMRHVAEAAPMPLFAVAWWHAPKRRFATELTP